MKTKNTIEKLQPQELTKKEQMEIVGGSGTGVSFNTLELNINIAYDALISVNPTAIDGGKKKGGIADDTI